MKKAIIFLSLLFVLGVFLHGQTQRMVLYEGFTNASCPYCPAANQSAQSLVLSNLTKVAPLKYHVNWPGTDPLNAQTQTWAGTRVTYYGITGVPASQVDGAASTSFTQTTINQRYAIPSPFSMSVTHSFNAAMDSVFFSVYIKAEQNISNNSLYLRTAMVEKKIEFATPPGSNGEKVFYNVMRRMYPDAAGILLPANWTTGKDTTIYFQAPIPSYIYDKNQIAFVAFIQSNSDKIVQQATKTIYNYHVGITNDNFPKFPTCSDNLNLQLTVTNFGQNTINSFDVEYGIVGDTPHTYNWTGTLNWGEQTTVNLPQINVTGPNLNVYAEIKNLNVTFQQDNNDLIRIEKKFPLIQTYTPIPLTENFSSTTFPPSEWFVVSNDNLTWVRSTAGSGSAKMEFYSSPSGEIDYLYIKPLNLNAQGSQIRMTFSVAHAPYNAQYGPNDRLEVQISTDCGQNWVTLYNKSGSTGLSTAPATTNQFTPTSSQWRTDTINLTSYNNQSEVLIRFKATSGYGNNLYVDNVKIDIITSVPEFIAQQFNIYPNPAQHYLSVSVPSELNQASLKITDITGRIVYQTQLNNIESMNIPLDGWNAGWYFVTLSNESYNLTKVFMKQ